jgi:2-oxoglutarate dehydrogenase complex dehydrogenase (E1) component-like enzyme
LSPELGDIAFERVSRRESAAPSVGQVKVHQEELRSILEAALA